MSALQFENKKAETIMATPNCGTCGTKLQRVTVKREGKWYCPNCKETK